MSDISKDILDLLESSGKPLSLSEIANNLCYSRSSLMITLKNMVDEKKIQSYSRYSTLLTTYPSFFDKNSTQFFQIVNSLYNDLIVNVYYLQNDL